MGRQQQESCPCNDDNDGNDGNDDTAATDYLNAKVSLKRDTVNGIFLDGHGHIHGGGKKTLKKILKQCYRYVMDGIEEWAMSYSDLLCVNSKFTKTEVLSAFPRLGTSTSNINDNDNLNSMQVLYPAIDLKSDCNWLCHYSLGNFHIQNHSKKLERLVLKLYIYILLLPIIFILYGKILAFFRVVQACSNESSCLKNKQTVLL